MKKTLLLLSLFLFSAPPARSSEARNVDSTLLAFYYHINNHIREPWVLGSTDTLYRMAGEKGDIRMQAVALTFKADHYYSIGRLDSLKAWIPRVQQFARDHGQLKYYYFVWTRLVTHYIKQGQYAIAVFELEKILEQADHDDYKDATASAYTQLGHIYRTKSLHRQAADYYRKAISYIEENGLDGFSLTTLYCNLLTEVMEDPQCATEIPHLLNRAEACVVSPNQKVSVARLRSLHYLNTGQLAQAAETIAALRRAAETGKQSLSELQLLELEMILANESGDLRKARRLAGQMIDLYTEEGVDPTFFTFIFTRRSAINRQLGDYRAAYEDLYTAYGLQMKKSEKETGADLDEFATLLGVEQLTRDKAELEKRAHEQQLRRVRTTVVALCGLLLLCALFIWAQWRLMRRLAAAKRAAEEADRMKGIFIRNVSHEINTPLNAVLGFAHVASDPSLPPDERASYLNIIEENSSYLRKLVDDVLCISDLETAPAPLACAPTDIDSCCTRAIEKACSVTEGPSIVFRPRGDGRLFGTSAYGIIQVLANLLHNARKFGGERDVELAWTPETDGAERVRLTFTVTDTGCGIPPAERERIFERFVKLDPYGQGLGLGLSVCRLVARHMGGEVWLDTSFTEGTRFVFTIPAV